MNGVIMIMPALDWKCMGVHYKVRPLVYLVYICKGTYLFLIHSFIVNS